jgi:crossover junction endodeoxyribonuclease RusA
MSQTFTLDWPPSTNRLWRNLSGRTILSEEARAWTKTASLQLMAMRARPMQWPVELGIELSPPTKRKFDLSNRVKIVEDILVHNSIIPDDNSQIIKRLIVERGEGFTGVRVTISEAA